MNDQTLAKPQGKTSRQITTSNSSEESNNLPGNRQTAAEFFAGIGLMRLGLEKEGWSVVYANDVDSLKKEMYEAHYGVDEAHFVLDDIHNISAESIPTVMLATASFPCNDLSLAGARNGLAGKQSSAFWGFVRVLTEMKNRRPPLILIENVPGFLTSHGGKDFREAMLALNALGYTVDPFLLDAIRFVPQSRQRLFVVGTLRDGQNLNSQGPIFTDSDLRSPILNEFIFWNSDIKWAIKSLPSPPKRQKKLVDILERIPHSSAEWWSEERATYLLNQMSPRHFQQAQRMIEGRTWSYGTVFRRVRNSKSMAELRVDGIAGCLRTPRGGSGRQILFKAGKGQYFVRLLTARECARLMGADDYKIQTRLNQALFGFGDAVCVPVIEWIAQHYLNPAAEELNALITDQTYGKKEAAVA